MTLADEIRSSYKWDRALNKTVQIETDVVALVLLLEKTAASHGYNVSRWQTNGAKFTTKITWAIHSGERQQRFDMQGEVIAHVILTQEEGKTTGCEAWRGLKMLLDQLQGGL